MGSITLEKSDWLYNAGIVGLCNILKYNKCEYDDSNANYVKFDEKCLENFEEKYFMYFINNYKKFTSWYKIVSFQSYIDKLDLENLTEDDLEHINAYIEYLREKLKSNSYKSAYLLLDKEDLKIIEHEKHLRKIKLSKKQTIKDVTSHVKSNIEIIEHIIINLKKEKFRKYILSKNIIYDIIQKFWCDVSFLNKNNSKKDMFIEYEKYFLNPVKEYISINNENAKYTCFNCERKVSKLKDTFGLSWINKVGVDMSRKTSHFWNMNGDTYICPICNLVYSCIPAGFTMIMGRGIFINDNSTMKNLININKHAITDKTLIEELEDETYLNIIDIMNYTPLNYAKNDIENIQIIKLDCSNEKRPYTFNIMCKNKLDIICKYKGALTAMLKVHVKVGSKEYIHIYREVLNRICNKSNLFDLIQRLMYINLNDKFSKLHFVEMILIINNHLLKGSQDFYMLEDKDIYGFRIIGQNFKTAYENRNANVRLNSISYKILNALKTKNTNKFMETLIGAYMYLNMAIPKEFLNIMKDENTFQTIGYAFLIGLRGKNISNIRKEDF